MPPLSNFPKSFEVEKAVAFIPAEATAGSTASNVVFLSDKKVLITRIDIVPQAAITANGTNFFTLTFQDRGAAGTGTTSLGARSWNATNSVAYVDENVRSDATSAPYVLEAGRALAAVRTVGGAGLASPQILAVISYVEVGDNWQL